MVMMHAKALYHFQLKLDSQHIRVCDFSKEAAAGKRWKCFDGIYVLCDKKWGEEDAGGSCFESLSCTSRAIRSTCSDA